MSTFYVSESEIFYGNGVVLSEAEITYLNKAITNGASSNDRKLLGTVSDQGKTNSKASNEARVEGFHCFESTDRGDAQNKSNIIYPLQSKCKPVPPPRPGKHSCEHNATTNESKLSCPNRAAISESEMTYSNQAEQEMTHTKGATSNGHEVIFTNESKSLGDVIKDNCQPLNEGTNVEVDFLELTDNEEASSQLSTTSPRKCKYKVDGRPVPPPRLDTMKREHEDYLSLSCQENQSEVSDGSSLSPNNCQSNTEQDRTSHLSADQTFHANIENKDEEGICKILDYLRIPEFKSIFQQYQINGSLLVGLSREDFATELNMSEFQAMKLDKYIHGWRPRKPSNTKDRKSHIESLDMFQWSCDQVYENMKSLHLWTFSEFCKASQVDGELLTSILKEGILQDIRVNHRVQMSKIEELKLFRYVLEGWRPDKIKIKDNTPGHFNSPE